MIYGRNRPPAPLASIPLNCTSEQMPNPDSRIGLGKDLDVFGLRKVIVDWQLTGEDKRGMATGTRVWVLSTRIAAFTGSQTCMWPAARYFPPVARSIRR